MPDVLAPSTGIRYIRIGDGVAADALDGLPSGDRFYPLDIPSLDACEERGLACHFPAAMADNPFADHIFSASARALTRAQYSEEFFGPVFAPVNPLVVMVHWLVSLFGSVAVKANDLIAIENDAGGQPAILVESAGEIPFVMTYGDIVAPLFGGRPPRIVTPVRPPPSLRLRLARMKVRARQVGNSLRQWAKPECWGKPELLLFPDLADGAGIVAANRRRGHPFHIRELGFTKPLSTPSRDQWVLPALLPRLAELVHREAALELPLDIYRACVLAAYDRIGGDFEASLAAALADRPKRTGAGGVVVVPATTKMPARARIYRLWRAGWQVATQVYSDGDMSGCLDMDLAFYRTALSRVNFYCGPVGRLEHERVAAAEVMPAERVWKAIPVGPPRPVVLAGSRQRPRTIYYLPTSFSGDIRLGPQREINDVAYWRLQLDILKALGGIEGVKLVYKAHPKSFIRLSKRQIAQIEALGAAYVTDPLDRILSGVGCLVADTFASGVGAALRNATPVVLLELGHRRMRPEVDALARRCMSFVPLADGWQDALRHHATAALSVDPTEHLEAFMKAAVGSDLAASAAENLLSGLVDEFASTKTA